MPPVGRVFAERPDVERLNSTRGTLPLLHVDDSGNDRLLVKRAISLTNAPFEYHEADGMESAMEYFQFHSRKRRPHPALLLLDYDMCKYTGADFLYWLRVVKKITSVPVVMFSGSVGKRHIAECYAAGANYFLSKTGNLERLKLIVSALYIGAVTRKQSTPILLLKEYQPDPGNYDIRAQSA